MSSFYTVLSKGHSHGVVLVKENVIKYRRHQSNIRTHHSYHLLFLFIFIIIFALYLFNLFVLLIHYHLSHFIHDMTFINDRVVLACCQLQVVMNSCFNAVASFHRGSWLFSLI